MSTAEVKVAQAFVLSSPLQGMMETMENELVRIRKTEDQVKGLLDRYWGTLAEIDGATFSVQFDRLDPEYTLRRGYLESRPQVIQLLADGRPNLSNARMVKKRFCEQAEEVTKSLVQRWPTGAAECPFSVVTEEEVHTFRQRVRAGRRNEADQVSRHWSRPPAEYGIRLEERTDVYGRAPVPAGHPSTKDRRNRHKGGSEPKVH